MTVKKNLAPSSDSDNELLIINKRRRLKSGQTFHSDSSDGDKLPKERNRLYTDYKDLSVLGSGNFGQVHRGTHKLDKMDYAIKEMQISGPNKTRLELYAMASLAMCPDERILKHIVRYFTSW